MFCPKCKAKTIVIDTHSEDDYVVRRRMCKLCGHKFTTEEYEAVNDDLIHKHWSDKMRQSRLQNGGINND